MGERPVAIPDDGALAQSSLPEPVPSRRTGGNFEAGIGARDGDVVSRGRSPN